MEFNLSITDDDELLARITVGEQNWDLQLAKGFWTANDYRAHWAFTTHDLLDYWRTRFLILEARPTGAVECCRAFRISRIADRFHFHDVLIAAPATIGGNSGLSLIEWLNRGVTPVLASGRPGHGPPRDQVVPEFIVEHFEFERWHCDELDAKMPKSHRNVCELVTNGDCA